MPIAQSTIQTVFTETRADVLEPRIEEGVAVSRGRVIEECMVRTVDPVAREKVVWRYIRS